MNKEKDADEKKPLPHDEAIDDPEQAGKKAIEANRKNNYDNDPQQRENEKKDAEQWRNEG